MSDELFKSEILDNLEMNKVEENYTSSRLFTSKIHNFGNLPKPRNATEVFHSKLYDLNIPNNINDFNKSNEQYNKKLSSDSEKLPKEFINLQNSNKIIQQQMKRKDIDIDDDEKETIQQKMKRQNIGDIDDEDEVYNNPNLHSEEQDELEIPDGKFLNK
ncbi:hypothetical protein C1646_682825 [Rhizophagus diaphanus]|nr:hypothetical protein C1646_682825 [Rhizophagus diaphanus] [Rhizophagus sp. MUCL 43196]